MFSLLKCLLLFSKSWRYISLFCLSSVNTILAFTLQLSDPDEYEGGDVELAVNDDLEDPITLPKERGQMCIFDTRTKHRVLPVTKGTRHTLVGWAIGPRWK